MAAKKQAREGEKRAKERAARFERAAQHKANKEKEHKERARVEAAAQQQARSASTGSGGGGGRLSPGRNGGFERSSSRFEQRGGNKSPGRFERAAQHKAAKERKEREAACKAADELLAAASPELQEAEVTQQRSATIKTRKVCIHGGFFCM
jgi:hypothetical protein